MINLKYFIALLLVTLLSGHQLSCLWCLHVVATPNAFHPDICQPIIADQSTAALPLLEQVLEKYIRALGGRAALQSITSRIAKGSISAPLLGNAQGTIEIYARQPNKQLTEIKAPVLGVLRTGFNGTLAWEEDNGKVQDAPDFIKREADFYFPLKMRELYPRLELKGKEKTGGTEAYRIEAQGYGKPKRWYFDVETGLLIRKEVRDATDKLLSSEDYEDYRVIDGIKIAFITRSFEDNLTFIVKLNEVKHNLAIDDAIFEKPAAAAVPALTGAEQEAAAQVKTETIREVTTVLASREMEGRGMAQPGGERAAKYLAEKFARAGLKPGGDRATYFQPMKVKVQTPLPATAFKVGNHAFKFKTDFGIAQPPVSPSAMKKVRAPMVFVGYGVVSQELKRNDLAGLDIKGKIVLVLSGKPNDVDTAIWEKAAATRVVFGRLIEEGAAGFVVTYEGDQSRFPMIAAVISNRSVSLTQPLSQPTSAARWSIELLADQFKVPPAVLLSDRAAENIFAAQRIDFAQIKQKAEAGEFVSCNLKVQASISPHIKYDTGMSSNIIGVVEGSDARLKNEALIYTAHYDHFGKDTEGTIYPGAADNALGVGKMLAIAEVIAKLNPKPRRSIIFIATTGEEYDDLGAEYWLLHPTWPLDRVAANINFDGSIPELWGKLSFVPDYGFGHSDLNEVVRSVAAASDVYVIADPVPEQGFFYRSDQYAFVKRGIPALFLTGLPDEEPIKLLERAKNWMTTHYHMPTDIVQPDWKWEGSRTLTALGLITGIRIANQEIMPAWKQNSPYNRPRGTTLPPPAK